jgi:RNA polymerase sigma factor (sigma-70 family)
MMERSGRAEATSSAEQLFTDVYEGHYRAVLAYFLRRGVSAEDAADATAETFAVVLRRSDQLPQGDPRPWLYGVARRVLANQHRAERRRAALRNVLQHTTRSEENSDGAGADLLSALDRLSVSDRELLLLTAWEGLAPREIAQTLEVPASIVSVRLYRARRRLRAQMARRPTDTAATRGSAPLTSE